MTFDDQLRTTFDRLTDRLREDAGRLVVEATTDLAAAVEAERAAAAKAVADAAARVEEAVAARLAAAETAAQQRGWDEGRRDGYAAAQREAAAEMEAAVAAAEAARKAARAEALDEGHRQGLAQGREEGRQEGLTQGRDEGRQQAQAGAERAAAPPPGDRLAEAIRAIDGARSLSETLDTLVSCAGREAARVGVLIARGSALQGWRFIGFGAALDEGRPLHLSISEAGIVADAIRTGLVVAADGKSPAPAFAELPAGRDARALPVPMSGQVVAVLYADQGPTDRSDAQPAAAWSGALEVMTRHAARCLEVLTALRAAQAQAGDGKPGGSIAGAPPEDEEQAARRYARLLVSEIKLYHEAEVLAGRRERDLKTRLGGEIARARVLYEQRVSGPVTPAADHFQAELVKTLADGDATLLEASR